MFGGGRIVHARQWMIGAKLTAEKVKKVGGSFADQDQPIRQRKLLSPGHRSQSKSPEKDQELSFSVVLFCVIYLSS